MGAARVVRDAPPLDAPARDARLTAGLAAACVAALALFVVVPSAVAGFTVPAGLDGLWGMGGLLTIVLAPLVTGLCGYASLAALWTHGDLLPTPARHLHLVTLLLVAAVWLGLVSSWGSGVVAWWMD